MTDFQGLKPRSETIAGSPNPRTIAASLDKRRETVGKFPIGNDVDGVRKRFESLSQGVATSPAKQDDKRPQFPRTEPLVRPPLPRANSIPTWVKPESEPAKPGPPVLRRPPSEGSPAAAVRSPFLKADAPSHPPSPVKLPAADDHDKRIRAETVTPVATRIRSGAAHEGKISSPPIRSMEPLKPAPPELPADNWQKRLEQEADSNRELTAAQDVASQQVIRRLKNFANRTQTAEGIFYCPSPNCSRQGPLKALLQHVRTAHPDYPFLVTDLAPFGLGNCPYCSTIDSALTAMSRHVSLCSKAKRSIQEVLPPGDWPRRCWVWEGQRWQAGNAFPDSPPSVLTLGVVREDGTVQPTEAQFITFVNPDVQIPPSVLALPEVQEWVKRLGIQQEKLSPKKRPPPLPKGRELTDSDDSVPAIPPTPTESLPTPRSPPPQDSFVPLSQLPVFVSGKRFEIPAGVFACPVLPCKQEGLLLEHLNFAHSDVKLFAAELAHMDLGACPYCHKVFPALSGVALHVHTCPARKGRSLNDVIQASFPQRCWVWMSGHSTWYSGQAVMETPPHISCLSVLYDLTGELSSEYIHLVSLIDPCSTPFSRSRTTCVRPKKALPSLPAPLALAPSNPSVHRFGPPASSMPSRAPNSKGYVSDLHKHLQYVHRMRPSLVTASLADYSERVQSSVVDGELGDISRLRFLINAFQPKLVCEAYVPACKDCDRDEDSHPWNRSSRERCPRNHALQEIKAENTPCSLCRSKSVAGTFVYQCRECRWEVCVKCMRERHGCLVFVKNEKKLCAACGKYDAKHPLQEELALECLCGNDTAKCLMSSIKTYMAYGIREVVIPIIQQNRLGTTPLSQSLTKWGLALAWLLVLASQDPSFPRCAGGKQYRIEVLPQAAADACIVIFDDKTQRREVKKKISEVHNVVAMLAELLSSEIMLPGITKPECTAEALSEFFHVLLNPFNYRKVLQHDRAREIFLSFVDAERSPNITGAFQQATKDLFEQHRVFRQLPSNILEVFIQLAVGDPLRFETLTPLQELPAEAPPPYMVRRITAPAMFSVVLNALHCVSDELAMMCLKELYVCFFRDTTDDSNRLKNLFSRAEAKQSIDDDIARHMYSQLLLAAAAPRASIARLQSLPTTCVRHMSQLLLADKAKFESICGNNIDTECWMKMLEFVTEDVPAAGPETAPSSLHDLFLMVYNCYPSSSTSSLLIESQRIQQERDGEVADTRRVRYLCNLLYHKRSCETVIPTCKKCGQEAKNHPVPAKLCCPIGHALLSGAPNLTCTGCNHEGTTKACKECKWGLCTDCWKKREECRNFVASDMCICLRPKTEHPYSSPLECVCRSNRQEGVCLVHLAKLLFAFGIRDLIAGLFKKAKSPMLQRWCIHLLWSLATVVTVSGFSRCFGRTFLRLPLLSMKADEVVIGVEDRVRKKIVRASLADTKAFFDAFIEHVTAGTKEPGFPLNPACAVFLTTFPRLKAKMADSSELEHAQLALSQFLELLTLPHHRWLSYIPKANDLLLQFLDIDSDLEQACKTTFASCITDLANTHRVARSIPMPVAVVLVELLNGAPNKPSLETDISSSETDASQMVSLEAECKVLQLGQPWLLPQLFEVLACSQNEVAQEVLRNLNIIFIRKPSISAPLYPEPNFIQWFFPLLFDLHEDTKDDEEEDAYMDVKQRGQSCYALSINILGIIHSNHVLEYVKSLKVATLSPGKLFANHIAQIGLHSSSKNPNNLVVSWSKKNVDILKTFASSVFGKLVAATHIYRNSHLHPAWTNMFDVFNVYRNMTWCPLAPGEKDKLSVVVAHLLSPTIRIGENEDAMVLVQEHTVATLCNLLQQLKLFDLELSITGPDTAQVKSIKGDGLAFTSYFRELLACLKTSRMQSANDKLLAHFFATYRFNRAYNKEEEDRLKALEQNQVRRRRTVMTQAMRGLTAAKAGEDTPLTEEEMAQQRTRDFEAADSGITVWNISEDKKQVAQCYIYLKKAAAVSTPKIHSILAGRKAPVEKQSYVLVLESKRKKTLPFEQVTITLGTCETKLMDELEYAQQMAITIRSNKKRTWTFVCTSIDDFECWTRVLHYLSSMSQSGEYESIPP